MRNIEEKIKGSVIPTADEIEDIVRAKKAIEYNKKNNLNIPYILSGLGPDTNKFLEGDFNGEINFHKELYEYMMNNTKEIFGVDINALDTVGNILQTFPSEQEGKYLFFSYPLHNLRTRLIEKDLKREKAISENLKIIYVNTTKNLFKNLFYETLAFTKYFLIKRNKLKNLAKGASSLQFP
ncbi:MAG: hypothetical protein ABIE36_00050 [Candidatus Diapherotrites archaeon]